MIALIDLYRKELLKIIGYASSTVEPYTFCIGVGDRRWLAIEANSICCLQGGPEGTRYCRKTGTQSEVSMKRKNAWASH